MYADNYTFNTGWRLRLTAYGGVEQNKLAPAVQRCCGGRQLISTKDFY